MYKLYRVNDIIWDYSLHLSNILRVIPEELIAIIVLYCDPKYKLIPYEIDDIVLTSSLWLADTLSDFPKELISIVVSYCNPDYRFEGNEYDWHQPIGHNIKILVRNLYF
jgi:hypothetical protein